MTVLHTIGYEGASIAAFIDTLRAADIITLIDVRDAPVSRKRGFSKHALSAALQSAGIGYAHLHWLGNPKSGRDAGRAGDIDTYHRIFFARLATPETQAALAEAGRLAAHGGACLMCYERDPAHCHRTLLARELRDRHGFTISALAPPLP